MKRRLNLMVLAAMGVAQAHIATAQQAILDGAPVEPTREECLAAIERGIQISAPAEGTRLGRSYFIYNGRMYLVAVGFGQLACSAWEI